VDTFETITCDIAGPVATVTLNQPAARNALSTRMVEELLTCFTALAGEEGQDVRVAVLQAAGSVFCAGGDVRDLVRAGATAEDGAALARLDTLLRAVNEAPQVVVARIQGPALGGGFGLVCVSDIALAGESAAFALPEVRLGIVPAVISPYVVARVGLIRARQLMLTGARIGAAEALRIGLVERVVPAADLMKHAMELARELAGRAPLALRYAKEAVVKGLGMSLEDGLRLEGDLSTLLRTTEDRLEGARAFLEKRKPNWKGM